MVRQPDDRGELGRFLAPRRLRGLYAAALRQLARRRVGLYGDARTIAPGYQRGGAAGARQTADRRGRVRPGSGPRRSEEHTSELQSLMRISYAVFCLKKKKNEPTPIIDE